MAVPGCQMLKQDRAFDSGQSPIELPEVWKSLGEEVDDQISSGWLDEFNDPVMKQLVQEGLANNPGLNATSIRLRAIREGIVQVRAGQLPRVGSSISASESGSSFRDANGNYSDWSFNDSYSGGLNVSWEMDVWGKLENREQAAIKDYEAAVSDLRGSRLSLAANIARAYCNLVTAGKQVELSLQTLDSFKSNYRITERNYIAGDPSATPLAVQFGRNNVASAERTVINRKLNESESRRTLEVLLGRYPGSEISANTELPELVEDIPAGIPSDLLMRRPDLVSAALRLESATQRKFAARKNLLPSINLSGGGSVRSSDLADLLTSPQSIAANLAASLSQPVFQGGALKSSVKVSEAQELAAIESFASSALNAFREVESALEREESLARQEESLEIELFQANLAEDQASRDYSEGLVDILSILEAQRRAFNARNSMISLRNSRIQNRITLHLALGGDFDENEADFTSNNLSHN